MSKWYMRFMFLGIIAALAGCEGTTTLDPTPKEKEPLYFTVTPTGDDHTQVLPASPQQVEEGERQTFQLTASSGYRLLSLVGGSCPAGSWDGSAYTTGAIVADCTVEFGSELVPPATFVVTASGDAKLEIDPEEREVQAGETASFDVTIAAGNLLVEEVGGSCPAGTWSDETYTTGSITANCTVEFAAEPITHAVVASAGDHVAVEPLEQLIAEGELATFSLTFDDGYALQPVVGGTCPAGELAGASYSTGPIVSACTVEFAAERIPERWVTVTLTDEFELLLDTAPAEVLTGTGVRLEVEAAPYLPFLDVTGSCPAGSWTEGIYTTGPIDETCEVIVQPKTLALPSEGGSFSVAAAFPATTELQVEGLPVAGRLLVASGRSLHLWQDRGGDSWIQVAEFTETMDPSFLAISPNGAQIAVGVGWGQPVYVFPTAGLSASYPPLISSSAEAQSFDVNHYSGTFYDERYFLVNGGEFEGSRISVIDLAQPDEPAFSLIDPIPGASGGVAVDAGGNVVTGIGWDPEGPRTGEVRIFAAEQITTHLASRTALSFDTDGLLLAPNLLSADSFSFDSQGRLFVGGGDAFSSTGQLGFAVLVDSAAIERVLGGGLPAEGSEITYIEPDACKDDYSVSIGYVAGFEMLLVSAELADPPGVCGFPSFGAPTYVVYFAPNAQDSNGNGIPDGMDPAYGTRASLPLREIAPLPQVDTIHSFSLTVDTADGAPRLGFMFQDPDYAEEVDSVLPRHGGVYVGNVVYVTERLEEDGWVAYNGRKTPQNYSYSELLVVDGTSFYTTSYNLFGGLISLIATGPAIAEEHIGKGLYGLTPAFTTRRAHSIAVFPGTTDIYMLAAQSGTAGFSLLSAPFSAIGDLGNRYITKAKFDEVTAADVYDPQLLVAGNTLIASYREGSEVVVRASANPGSIASATDMPVIGGCSNASLGETAVDGEYLYLACLDASRTLTLRRLELGALPAATFDEVEISELAGVDALDLEASLTGLSLAIRQGSTIRVWDDVSAPAPIFEESIEGSFDLVRSAKGLVLSVADLEGDKILRTFVGWPAD